MATTAPIRTRIQDLKKIYEGLKKGKEALLTMIDDVETAETVYNSNAIENSTLTLRETERILLEMEISRNASLREVFEAKNLARVTEYIRANAPQKPLNIEMILLLHKMLISNIKDEIAGRFRSAGEYVKVGTHIAPPPEHVERLVEKALTEFDSNLEAFITDKIAKFHLEFEHIHPFNDGNGRIGRAIVNYQLARINLPPIIVRNKNKQDYYLGFRDFDDSKNTKTMEKIINLAVIESLHKRITYLKNDVIMPLTDYAKKHEMSVTAALNAARRQNIAAFREKGVWKIGASFAGNV